MHRLPRRTVVQVIGELRSELRDGKVPQQRLDTERVMAKRLGCSRDTLRAALVVLEQEELVWRHVGKGTFVGPRPVYEAVPPLVLAEAASPADVMEARLLLEPGIAAMAADRTGPSDVARLRADALRTHAAADWQSYERADNAFHLGIAALSRNPMAIAFYGVLSGIRSRAHWQRQHDRTFRRGAEGEYARRQGNMHRRIVDAIERRDGPAASDAMRRHLLEIQALMTDVARLPAN